MIPVSDQNAVLDAMNAYEALSAEDKAQVSNYDKLEKDIASLSSLAEVCLVYNGNGGTAESGDASGCL